MFFLVQISYEEGRKVENCTGGECRVFLSYSVKFLVYAYLTQNGFYPSYVLFPTVSSFALLFIYSPNRLF